MTPGEPERIHNAHGDPYPNLVAAIFECWFDDINSGPPARRLAAKQHLTRVSANPSAYCAAVWAADVLGCPVENVMKYFAARKPQHEEG